MNQDILAKKYAIAFLNVYKSELSIGDIERLEILESFLKSNRFFYISLRIPTIPRKTKNYALDKIVENYQFKPPVAILMKNLLENDRIDMLHKVINHIRHEYAKREHLEFFTIKTSHELTTNEKKVIVKLIQNLTTATIRTDFIVDENLIVGIRIESPVFLWERSIKKELEKVSNSIAKEGIRC